MRFIATLHCTDGYTFFVDTMLPVVADSADQFLFDLEMQAIEWQDKRETLLKLYESAATELRASLARKKGTSLETAKALQEINTQLNEAITTPLLVGGRKWQPGDLFEDDIYVGVRLSTLDDFFKEVEEAVSVEA